ncbi:hypothetical protein B5F27_10290 [Faecalibacterium sp. An192]|nr:hypothetical protein B5F27_10290 [Faecalibacterium sp. An192]
MGDVFRYILGCPVRGTVMQAGQGGFIRGTDGSLILLLKKFVDSFKKIENKACIWAGGRIQ